MEKKRQKRIALINDITGFGRCSLTVALPIISALKVEACPLPTAILSVHTGFPTHWMDDFTDRMRPYMDSWEENGLSFDGIATGFIGSAAQIGLVIDCIRRFRKPETRVMVDPVMGDDGKLYASYTPEMCREMRRLLSCADLVTPNLTEACQLLEEPYPEDGRLSEAALCRMARAIADKGPSQVVITGLSEGSRIRNFIYERGKGTDIVSAPRVGSDRCGTGDVFAAIVAGSLVRGENLSASVRKAADFIVASMAYTETLGIPGSWGLAFEEHLTDLK